MSVVIETTMGDLTVDLFTDERPVACLNFLKLCKLKYYNFNLFHTIQQGFIAQTGDPTGVGDGGSSVWGLTEGPEKRFFEAESLPKIYHSSAGLLSLVSAGKSLAASQFFLTLGNDLTSLDGVHCVIGEVVEGHETLRKLNEAIVDDKFRPYQDIRVTHTVVLDDPFPDPRAFQIPSRSPSPSAERLQNGRIAADEDIDDTDGKSMEQIVEMVAEREAKARATILEIVGDLPDAEMAPPENVLFVCKLNPVTTDDDLEIIFSRFGKIKACEVIRDRKSNESLQYAFVEFEDKKSCEAAYFKMDNVLIDDRRIHVDFSQSVAKVKWRGKGRGVVGESGRLDFNNLKDGGKSNQRNGNERKRVNEDDEEDWDRDEEPGEYKRRRTISNSNGSGQPKDEHKRLSSGERSRSSSRDRQTPREPRPYDGRERGGSYRSEGSGYRNQRPHMGMQHDRGSWGGRHNPFYDDRRRMPPGRPDGRVDGWGKRQGMYPAGDRRRMPDDRPRMPPHYRDLPLPSRGDPYRYRYEDGYHSRERDARLGLPPLGSYYGGSTERSAAPHSYPHHGERYSYRAHDRREESMPYRSRDGHAYPYERARDLHPREPLTDSLERSISYSTERRIELKPYVNDHSPDRRSAHHHSLERISASGRQVAAEPRTPPKPYPEQLHKRDQREERRVSVKKHDSKKKKKHAKSHKRSSRKSKSDRKKKSHKRKHHSSSDASSNEESSDSRDNKPKQYRIKKAKAKRTASSGSSNDSHSDSSSGSGSSSSSSSQSESSMDKEQRKIFIRKLKEKIKERKRKNE